MAQRVNILLEDDLDGSDADETVSFGLDGKNYAIDLTSAHATELRDALAAYIAAGRSAGRSSTGRGSAARRGSADAGEIREWAKSQGLDVSERGRIAADVRDAYNAAH